MGFWRVELKKAFAVERCIGEYWRRYVKGFRVSGLGFRVWGLGFWVDPTRKIEVLSL